ncbi:MAG: hypothetical protein D4R39_02335 [Methylophilaceae bacterium]|nr:MAG: hypothetical protein D4R39_02335 [Methylophilaceae bacterium]
MFGPSVDEIAQLLFDRQALQGPMIENMRQLRDTYNGDLVIPLPEMDRREKSAVANLITTGLDQTAMRIASTMPSVYYPALEDGNRASEKRASTRKRATMGWWEANKMPLKMRRRARWLIGYASSPVILRPDTKWGAARWDIRDPLNTFPSSGEDPDEMTPQNCIFTYTRSRAWMQTRYPDALSKLKSSKTAKPDDLVRIAEYTDAEVTVLMASSTIKPNLFDTDMRGLPNVELERIHNKTGMCLAVVPGRITLDRPMGQFDSLVGMYNLQSKLMALEVIAVERGIFPDTYLISRPGETARFVAGPYDGRSGQVNVVQGGDIREMAANPGFATNGMMDRIERAQRIASGTPAEFGGESTSNVRTGKRGDAILSAVVDFPIQEAQEIFAASLQEENKRAIAICKTYFGNERKSFYVSSRGAKGHVDYVPNKDFEDDNNVVTYSHSGADANSLVVGLGQRIGIGIMSKQTAQEIDPFISDPEMEKDRVVSEGLEQALLQSIQTQASQGAIPPADVAAIVVLVASDKMDLAAAVTKVHDDAQKRQATVAPAGAPETMPGLGAPGMGAEQPVAPQAAQPQDIGAFLASLGAGK